MMFRRFEPGSRAMAMGQRTFNCGNAFDGLKGSAGFGEPRTREVVQEIRLSIPEGRSARGFEGVSAAGRRAAKTSAKNARIQELTRMSSVPIERCDDRRFVGCSSYCDPTDGGT